MVLYANMTLKIYFNDKKQPLEVFFEIDILKNFANFTGKHPCWSLLLIIFLLYIFHYILSY